jgi:hypothetical protein
MSARMHSIFMDRARAAEQQQVGTGISMVQIAGVARIARGMCHWRASVRSVVVKRARAAGGNIDGLAAAIGSIDPLTCAGILTCVVASQ